MHANQAEMYLNASLHFYVPHCYKNYFSGVGKSAWLLWIIVAVLLQMITFIVIYVKLTMTEFQKQQIVHQEQARLLDQEDGKPLHYGGGMMYR